MRPGEVLAGGGGKLGQEFQSGGELAAAYAARHQERSRQAAGLDDEAFARPLTVRIPSGSAIARAPGGLLLHTLMQLHAAHHRGQMMVSLRLLGRPVPGLCGPVHGQGAGEGV